MGPIEHDDNIKWKIHLCWNSIFSIMFLKKSVQHSFLEWNLFGITLQDAECS